SSESCCGNVDRTCEGESHLQPGRAAEPEFWNQSCDAYSASLSPEPADPATRQAVAVQWYGSAEVDDRTIRRTDSLPSPQQPAGRRDEQRRLRTPHHQHARTQRPPRRRERRVHRRVLLSDRVL